MKYSMTNYKTILPMMKHNMGNDEIMMRHNMANDETSPGE